MSPSQAVSDKAVRLLESGAVIVDSADRARVRGDSGQWWHVTAFDDGIYCGCPSRHALCAHSLAASLAWAEASETATAGLEPKAGGAATSRSVASPSGAPYHSAAGAQTPTERTR